MTKKNWFFLLLILAAAIFLRVYKIDTNYYFTGELGKELLYMRQYSTNGTIPLVGMGTSHEWLSYGPIYYWIMIPIFNIFSGNPYILFWSALVVSVGGLIANYWVFKRIANEKIAMFSTMIAAITPYLIFQTRLSKLHVFFFLIIPFYTYLLYLLWNGKKKWVFAAGLIFGILFSFHFSQIPLLGVAILLFWIKRNMYKIKDWILFGLGILIPNLTLIWQDKNLILWLPYRVFNITNKSPENTWRLISEFFGKSFFWDSRLWTAGLLIFAALFAHYIIQNRKRFTKDFLPFYLISSISLMLVANILHGVPPVHYFLPIATTLPVLYAIYLSKFKYWPFVLVPSILVNLISFTSDPVFYKNYTGLVKGSDMVSYSTQDMITSFITAESSGNPLMIKRIGAYDYFPEQYSQNYKYLILWKGGNLVPDSSNTYTIVENNEKGEISVQK